MTLLQENTLREAFLVCFIFRFYIHILPLFPVSDFDNDYKTLYPWYMESIWWVFSELWNKGLVYRGVKVMPYSTACNTPLSNFESGQNYKEVVDPAGKNLLYLCPPTLVEVVSDCSQDSTLYKIIFITSTINK